MANPPTSIHDLPNEILGAVFVQCLSPLDDLWGTKTVPAAVASEAPLLLRRICHRWCSVADTLPALWKNITIDLSTTASAILTNSFAEELDAKTTALIRWLHRAGQGAKVAFRLENTALEGAVPRERRAWVVEATIAALTRVTQPRLTSSWSALWIHACEPYQSYLLGLPRENLRSLERLHFRVYQEKHWAHAFPTGGVVERHVSSSGLVAAPNLTALVLAGVDMKDRLTGLGVANIANLRELELGGKYLTRYGMLPFLTTEVCTLLLRCQSSLVRLKLHMRSGPVPTSQWEREMPDRVELPSLCELEIKESSSGHVRQSLVHFQKLMAALITPVLTSLTFEGGCFDECGVSSLRGFVQANKDTLPTSLRHAKLAYNTLHPSELLPVLSVLGGTESQVTTLHLYALGSGHRYFHPDKQDPDHAIFWGRILDALNSFPSTVSGEDQLLFPALKHFECQLGRRDEFTTTDLWNFVQRRMGTPDPRGRTPLESINVKFVQDSDIDAEAHDALMKLEEDGFLSVRLAYSGECCWSPLFVPVPGI